MRAISLRSKALATSGLIALALALTAHGSNDEAAAGADKATPAATQAVRPNEAQGAVATAQGTFAGLNDKAVAGTVSIKGSTLTLAGFSSDEGPDLHLYLTNGTEETAVAAGTEMGKVAFDEASQTFTLDGVDAAGYTHLVVHCDKAKAVFGAASLT